MIFKYHPKFRKNYKQRIQSTISLKDRYLERLKLFRTDPQDPILRDHALTGELKGFRAFSINSDVRVVYFQKADTIHLYDIGTHNQVYK